MPVHALLVVCEILASEVGRIDLVLVCNQGSLVGLCVFKITCLHLQQYRAYTSFAVVRLIGADNLFEMGQQVFTLPSLSIPPFPFHPLSSLPLPSLRIRPFKYS